jgi:hypothetical protein
MICRLSGIGGSILLGIWYTLYLLHAQHAEVLKLASVLISVQIVGEAVVALTL